MICFFTKNLNQVDSANNRIASVSLSEEIAGTARRLLRLTPIFIGIAIKHKYHKQPQQQKKQQSNIITKIADKMINHTGGSKIGRPQVPEQNKQSSFDEHGGTVAAKQSVSLG